MMSATPQIPAEWASLVRSRGKHPGDDGAEEEDVESESADAAPCTVAEPPGMAHPAPKKRNRGSSSSSRGKGEGRAAKRKIDPQGTQQHCRASPPSTECGSNPGTGGDKTARGAPDTTASVLRDAKDFAVDNSNPLLDQSNDNCVNILPPPARQQGNAGNGGANPSVTGRSMQTMSIEDVCRNILNDIGSSSTAFTASGTPYDEELNVDCILSRVSCYKQMLNDLFSDQGAVRPNIPVVTKAYEESYMRQPVGADELECTMGSECECKIISDLCGEGFVGVQFQLPADPMALDLPRKEISGFCVLCNRKVTQSLFYDVVYSGKPYKGVIQKYGNICGVPGEYAREFMLICPPNGPVECMPYPMVSHQRNRYTVVNRRGVLFIVQRDMGHQDFGEAPSAAH